MNPVIGAEPHGTHDEQSASRAVQSMFNEIAPRYDLLNHILSANVDRLWWRRTARIFRPVLQNPAATVLDMCCGTGDMTLALLRYRPAEGAPLLALDFAHAMLARARQKFAALKIPRSQVRMIEADALHMPLADSSVNLITSAFGFRNLANYDAGLREMRRVLRPGGEIGILDFSEPTGTVGGFYRFYFQKILPHIGRRISGSAGSYDYLPRSVERFPAPEEMQARMLSCGFTRVSWTPYTFGIAGLYRAVKA
jgi:demethylmenaquinone methyltransferase/2-methoxy-6-polyprenyl-1,4-benzoquinol methylase